MIDEIRSDKINQIRSDDNTSHHITSHHLTSTWKYQVNLHGFLWKTALALKIKKERAHISSHDNNANDDDDDNADDDDDNDGGNLLSRSSLSSLSVKH